MSMIKDHSTTTTDTTKPPPTGCFLGCFSFSSKKKQHKDKKVNPSSRRRSWISKLNLSFKKTKIETVSVDLKHAPAKSNTTWEIEDDAKLTTKWTDSVKRQNGSFRSRRKETKTIVITSTKPTGAGVDLPEKKTVTILTHPVKPMTHLEIPPQPDRKKPVLAVVKGSPSRGGDEGRVMNKTTTFDSMVGMSIILVTLVIMMVWGKLCAILCTCAWFFIAPRFGEHVSIATAEKGWPESDLESVEYKKKVVLEGLLQRNHRNVVGRL